MAVNLKFKEKFAFGYREFSDCNRQLHWFLTFGNLMKCLRFSYLNLFYIYEFVIFINLQKSEKISFFILHFFLVSSYPFHSFGSVSCSAMSTSLGLHGYSPPGSVVHGFLPARILEWVAIPFPMESFQTKDWTQVFIFLLFYDYRGFGHLFIKVDNFKLKPECFSTKQQDSVGKFLFCFCLFVFYHIYNLHMKSSLCTLRRKVSRRYIDLNMVSLSEQKVWISGTQK